MDVPHKILSWIGGAPNPHYSVTYGVADKGANDSNRNKQATSFFSHVLRYIISRFTPNLPNADNFSDLDLSILDVMFIMVYSYAQRHQL